MTFYPKKFKCFEIYKKDFNSLNVTPLYLDFKNLGNGEH